MESGPKTQRQKRGKNKKAVFLLLVFAISFLFITVHYHNCYFELSDCSVCKSKFALNSAIHCEPVFEFFLVSHCEKVLRYTFTAITITIVSISNRKPPLLSQWHPTFSNLGLTESFFKISALGECRLRLNPQKIFAGADDIH